MTLGAVVRWRRLQEIGDVSVAAGAMGRAYIFLCATLALVLITVLLPSADIGWMRHRWKWFTYPLDWIKSVGGAVSLMHLPLFLLSGFAIGLVLPWRRIGWVTSILMCYQFFVSESFFE